jgi:hypothetical protein
MPKTLLVIKIIIVVLEIGLTVTPIKVSYLFVKQSSMCENNKCIRRYLFKKVYLKLTLNNVAENCLLKKNHPCKANLLFFVGKTKKKISIFCFACLKKTVQIFFLLKVRMVSCKMEVRKER